VDPVGAYLVVYIGTTVFEASVTAIEVDVFRDVDGDGTHWKRPNGGDRFALMREGVFAGV